MKAWGVWNQIRNQQFFREEFGVLITERFQPQRWEASILWRRDGQIWLMVELTGRETTVALLPDSKFVFKMTLIATGVHSHSLTNGCERGVISNYLAGKRGRRSFWLLWREKEILFCQLVFLFVIFFLLLCPTYNSFEKYMKNSLRLFHIVIHMIRCAYSIISPIIMDH